MIKIVCAIAALGLPSVFANGGGTGGKVEWSDPAGAPHTVNVAAKGKQNDAMNDGVMSIFAQADLEIPEEMGGVTTVVSMYMNCSDVMYPGPTFSADEKLAQDMVANCGCGVNDDGLPDEKGDRFVGHLKAGEWNHFKKGKYYDSRQGDEFGYNTYTFVLGRLPAKLGEQYTEHYCSSAIFSPLSPGLDGSRGNVMYGTYSPDQDSQHDILVGTKSDLAFTLTSSSGYLEVFNLLDKTGGIPVPDTADPQTFSIYGNDDGVDLCEADKHGHPIPGHHITTVEYIGENYMTHQTLNPRIETNPKKKHYWDDDDATAWEAVANGQWSLDYSGSVKNGGKMKVVAVTNWQQYTYTKDADGNDLCGPYTSGDELIEKGCICGACDSFCRGEVATRATFGTFDLKFELGSVNALVLTGYSDRSGFAAEDNNKPHIVANYAKAFTPSAADADCGQYRTCALKGDAGIFYCCGADPDMPYCDVGGIAGCSAFNDRANMDMLLDNVPAAAGGLMFVGICLFCTILSFGYGMYKNKSDIAAMTAGGTTEVTLQGAAPSDIGLSPQGGAADMA